MLTLLERQKLSFLARVCSSVIFVLCPMDESFLEAVRRSVCPLGHRLWPLTSLCTAGHSSFPNLVLLCAFLSWLPGMYVGHHALRYPGQKEPFQDGGAWAAVKSRAFRHCLTPSGLLVHKSSIPADPGFCFPYGNNLTYRTLAHVAKSVFC